MNILICAVPLHYYFFKSVYAYLGGAEFLIPPVADRPFSEKYGGGMSGRGQFDYIKKFLVGKGVRVSDYGEANKDNLVRYINDRADNIICPHIFDGIGELKDKRIIKLVYGIPSDNRSLKYEYIYLMDLIITFGDESVGRILNKKINSVAVGNPLFDDWFNNKINQDDLEAIRKRLNPSKRTLLYLPTWGEDSSIDTFFERIASFKDEYNIITKLHHCTFFGEANRLCRVVSHPDIIVLADYFDPLPAYKAADIIIADGMSGAAFDVILLGKPLIIVGASIKNYGIETYIDGENPTKPSILDSIPFVENPAELRETLKKTSARGGGLDQATIKNLFYSIDGQSGKRASEAIMDKDKYPAAEMLTKYALALQRVSGHRQRELIEGGKNAFLRRYGMASVKKRNPFSRVRRLIFNKSG